MPGGKPELGPAAEMELPLQWRCGPQVKLLVQVSSGESRVSLSGCAGGSSACWGAAQHILAALTYSDVVHWQRALSLFTTHSVCLGRGGNSTVSLYSAIACRINWTLTHRLGERREGKDRKRKGFVLCLIHTLALCKGTQQKEQHQQPCKQWLCFQLIWSELLWEANLLLTHITLELCWKLDVPSTPLLLIYT